MTVFRNVMVYLGLGPDEEYEDGYLYEDDPGHYEGPAAARGPANSVDGPSGVGSEEADARVKVEEVAPSAVGAVRPLRPVADQADAVVDLVQEERLVADQQQDSGSTRSERGRGTGSFGAGSGPDSHGVQSTSRMDPVVRAVPIQRTKPLAVVPETFADAKTIADEFQRSVPVIMNLQGLDRELARRLIDFASGVCYSLDGSMEKIASQVFLLTPKSVDVSDEDMRRIEERGYVR